MFEENETFSKIGLFESEWKSIIVLLHDDAKFSCEDEDWDTAFKRLYTAHVIESALNSPDSGDSIDSVD